MRVLVASVGWAGHALPAIGVARELRARGHRVVVDTAERWRGLVEESDLELAVAEERIAFGRHRDDGDSGPTMAEAVRARVAKLGELAPDLVVCDLFTLAPALAAELAEIRRATLVPHPYPRSGPGSPPFPLGLVAPRTALGEAAWRAARPLAGSMPTVHLRRGRRELNAVRVELGLRPVDRYLGQESEELSLVATFPQLEYPRRWPEHVHVTGPTGIDFAKPEIELPPGEAPLVFVAGSTEQDPELSLARACVEALAAEPVRVVVALNRDGVSWPGSVPANTAVAQWADYGRLMRAASVVVTSGGHGTVARALSDANPLLVCPAAGDTAATGARVAWTGAGLMLPRRLLAPRALRAALRQLLSEECFAARAGEIAAWARRNPGAPRAAELVERHLSGRNRPDPANPEARSSPRPDRA